MNGLIEAMVVDEWRHERKVYRKFLEEVQVEMRTSGTVITDHASVTSGHFAPLDAMP